MATKAHTKATLATALANTEVSVHIGHQTFSYWQRAHMRRTRQELVMDLARRADHMTTAGMEYKYAAVPMAHQEFLVALALEVL